METIATWMALIQEHPTLLQTLQRSAVTLKFQNLRPDAATVPAYISFGGGGALAGTNLADGAPLTKGTSYP